MTGTDDTSAMTDQGSITATWPTLRQGSSGRDVTTLQALLRSHGYSLEVDGSFGPATHGRVQAFQRNRGLVVDGVAGAKTWTAATPATVAKRGTVGWRGRAANAQVGLSSQTYGATSVSKWKALQQSLGLVADGVCHRESLRRALLR